MKKTIYIISFALLFVACKQVQKTQSNEEYYGNYWNYECIDGTYVLKIHKDNSFEYSDWNGFRIQGKVIFKNNKVLLRPAHKEIYEFKEIKNRADDSTFVYCFSGSYDRKDEYSAFRLLDKKGKRIKGIHTSVMHNNLYFDRKTMKMIDTAFAADTNGVLKLLLGDYDNIYLDVVASGYSAAFGMPEGIEIKEKITKGKDYYLWISEYMSIMTDISYKMEVEKESDSTIILKEKDKFGFLERRFFKIPNEEKKKNYE